MYNTGKKNRTAVFLRIMGFAAGFAIWAAAAFIFTGCNWSKINANAAQLSAMLTIRERVVNKTDANAANVAETAADGIVPENYESADNKTGGVAMNREFVEVALVAEDHFMLENTKGAFYWVDIQYNENYAEGDLLCLIYKDKVKLEEDCWKVEPAGLYVNDNRVNLPQF